MNSANLFTDQANEHHCDPQLLDIIADRITIWNRPLAYLLSGVVAFLLGFAAAGA